MGHHFASVHEEMNQTHPTRDPIILGEKNTQSTATTENASQGQGVPSLVGHAIRAKKRQKQYSTNRETDNQMQLSDSEDDSTDVRPVSTEPSDQERRLVIMRKVMRKWWRLAGMKGHPAMCDEQGEEFGVHWTRGICPRVEGRIIIIGGAS